MSVVSLLVSVGPGVGADGSDCGDTKMRFLEAPGKRPLGSGLIEPCLADFARPVRASKVWPMGDSTEASRVWRTRWE
ncbi:hypothetical protein AQJ64_29895 [Streptomyces griseoruber]|uniref:Uncharacterized protein n=1 Tax=Streptomyces griseoruber TaxID=1943 RepID=A0A101SSL9_9ACTN|nr:hypothetical protein AQJ64_29895 [Streptomyces griseoruber]